VFDAMWVLLYDVNERGVFSTTPTAEATAAAATTTGGWKRRYDCEDPFRQFRHLREEIKCVKISQHRLTKKKHFQD
jgi:hypothetical protein